MSSTAEHRANLRWLYLFCNDLAAVRWFYTELLGLSETSFKDEGEMNWLCYKCTGLEIVFTRPPQPLLVPDDWAEQPGWQGGTAPRVSWSIHIAPEGYAATVSRLQAAAVSACFDRPQWCQDSYWSYPARDPMGNTVEVYSEPETRPESTDWSAD